MIDKIFKPMKIGGSYFFHMPHEYMKVFTLIKNGYQLEVKNNGNLIIYKKLGEIEPSPSDELSEEDSVDEIIISPNEDTINTGEVGPNIDYEETNYIPEEVGEETPIVTQVTNKPLTQ